MFFFSGYFHISFFFSLAEHRTWMNTGDHINNNEFFFLRKHKNTQTKIYHYLSFIKLESAKRRNCGNKNQCK